MKRHLSLLRLDPERDCFIARESGPDVGLAILWPELPIRRAVLEIGGSGAHSPKAVEHALVAAAVARACVLSVSVLHTQILPEDESKRRLLYDAGFLPVRRYATMRWRGDALPNAELPEGFILRSFRAGHDTQRLTDIQNAAFGDSWGFSPNTVEQVEARVASKSTTPEGILFVTRGGRRCRVQLDGPSRGAGWQAGTHSDDRSPSRLSWAGPEPSDRYRRHEVAGFTGRRRHRVGDGSV